MFHMDVHFVFFSLFYNPKKCIYLHRNRLHSIATDAVSNDKKQIDCLLIVKGKRKLMSHARQLTCAHWSRTIIILAEIL